MFFIIAEEVNRIEMLADVAGALFPEAQEHTEALKYHARQLVECMKKAGVFEEGLDALVETNR